MKTENKLTDYLEKITGEQLSLEKMEKREYAGIPLLYYNTYDLIRWKWRGISVILAVAKSSSDLSPSEYSTHAQFLREHLKIPVALVLPCIDSYKRNRLVQHGIPFIIPGNQLFLPPFADLRERFPHVSHTVKDSLSAASQLVVIYHIFRKTADQYSLRELSSILGYSAMTMSNTCRELVQFGLCENDVRGKELRLKFKFSEKNLWDNSIHLFSSPVAKKIWANLSDGKEKLFRAGITALADYTMLNDEPVSCFACGKNMLQSMIGKGEIRHADGPDNADCLIESWKYDPARLSENGLVDRLSLYLSLKDSADERVQSSLDNILENMKW